MSFANLKRNRPDLNSLVETAQKAAGGTNNSSKDDRFWQPTRDKAGNGYAVIRFLPGLDTEGTPWVRYWDHAFKGPTGQWYIEKSLTTLGQQDPLSELNTKMWNNPGEFGLSETAAKAEVRKRSRNLRYVANVLIISDPSAPENEGQVKLFRFGKKIFDKLMDAMKPQFPDEAPVNPFDMWAGADFSLKIRKVDGYPNYDASTFKEPSALYGGDDDKLEAVYNKQHDIAEFVDPKGYKTYAELEARLNLVLGETNPKTAKAKVASKAELDDEIPFDRFEKEAAAPKMNEAPAQEFSAASSDMDEDDIMAKFAALANDD